jgi:hypothetical protein
VALAALVDPLPSGLDKGNAGSQPKHRQGVSRPPANRLLTLSVRIFLGLHRFSILK